MGYGRDRQLARPLPPNPRTLFGVTFVPGSMGPASPSRPGRCANHPGVARVGVCVRCGRSLCRNCATPVRGTIVGPECLPTLVEVPTRDVSLIQPVPLRGDRLAVAGFGLTLLASVFPWSRFGDSAHPFGAWTLHWSLLAVLGASLGVAGAALANRRPVDQAFLAFGYCGWGLVVAGAALLHHAHPPPLSVGTSAGLAGALGGLLAVAAGILKGWNVLRVRRRIAAGRSP